MTFSVAGRCPESGMLGVAVTTSSICVGSRCPWVRAGVGAVSTQNVTLPSIGGMVLDRIAAGASAEESVAAVMATQPQAEYRQVTTIDGQGCTAHFSGARTLGAHAVHEGDQCVAAGNLLRSARLPETMVRGFEERSGEHLAERLLAALEAGLYEAGGEQGPVHSACLLVAGEHAWPVVDLRVDWDDDDPLGRLRSLWRAYEPQMADYVTRALDPASAPSYGVPGDEIKQRSGTCASSASSSSSDLPPSSHDAVPTLPATRDGPARLDKERRIP